MGQRVGMRLAFLQRPRADRHVEACTGESQRRLAADAAAGAGNESHFVHRATPGR